MKHFEAINKIIDAVDMFYEEAYKDCIEKIKLLKSQEVEKFIYLDLVDFSKNKITITLNKITKTIYIDWENIKSRKMEFTDNVCESIEEFCFLCEILEFCFLCEILCLKKKAKNS